MTKLSWQVAAETCARRWLHKPSSTVAASCYSTSNTAAHYFIRHASIYSAIQSQIC